MTSIPLLVLDDLDNKLAEEQSSSSVNTGIPLNYGSRTQFSHFHPNDNRHGSITGRHKNNYNKTTNMSIYDILRPGTPREGFKTFSPRTRTIYDMYRTREPRVSKEDYTPKNTFGSTSLCLDSRQRSASQTTRHFTARSLHFPGTTQNKSGFILPTHQKSPKRTPLSSIIWNRSDSSEDRQAQEDFLNKTSPMDIEANHPSMYPPYFQENTRQEFYHSQNVYQNVNLHAPMDNKMSSDPFENSENMPFYPQDNPFARSFFSNTFGQNREQIFRQSSFGVQEDAHSPWSRFSRKPFLSSDSDFEMASVEADCTSTSQIHSVSSQHWESFSYSYRTNISRNQKEPHPWRFGSEAPTMENMEVSQDPGEQATFHFGMPNTFSTTGSSYHMTSGESEYQWNSYPRESPVSKEPNSLGIAQPLVSSCNTSFHQTSGDKRNPQSSNFQNSTVTLQKVPSKPIFLPGKGYREVTVTNRESIDNLPLTKNQPSVVSTAGNHDKDLNKSNLVKDEQLNKMDQTSMANEIFHPVSLVVDSHPLPDAHSSLSQDSTKNNRFVFSTPSNISSKRSPRVHPKKDNPRVYTSCRNKVNEFKKDKTCTENKKLGSAISRTFRTTSSFPSSNQSCHQELTMNNEGRSNTLQNNLWSSEPIDNPNTHFPEELKPLDNYEERHIKTHSSHSSESTAYQNNTYCSSPVNNSFSDTVMTPSTTEFSRRSASGSVPFLIERDEKGNDSKNQNNHVVPSSLEIQKRNDVCEPPMQDEAVTIVRDSSHSPLWDRRGGTKIRQSISSFEMLSKTSSGPAPTRESSNIMLMNENSSKSPQSHSVYCTFPRKSANILFNSKKSESNVMAPSLRGGTLPVPIKNIMEGPREQYSSHKSSVGSSESESEGSKVLAVLVPVVPTTGEEEIESKRTVESTSVDRKPLPFLERTMSCPSGVPLALTGRDERGKHLVSDKYASVVTPRPWERVISPLEKDASFREGSLIKGYKQNEYFPECTEKGGKSAAPGTVECPLSNEDSLPFPSDMSGKGSGKTVQKFKTTSTFSVSGDEANIKCFEVVSLYYTLPRQQSQKIGNFLQAYSQHTESLTESPKVRTASLPDSVKDKLKCSVPEPPGTPSPKDLTSTHRDCHLPFTATNITDLPLPKNGASGTKEAEKAHPHPMKSCNSGPFKLRVYSEGNIENSQMVTGAGRHAGRVRASSATTSGEYAQEDYLVDGLQPKEVRGQTETNFPKQTNTIRCDLESPDFALTPALHKLQLGEESSSDEPGIGSLQFEPREKPQRSQEVNRTGNWVAKNEAQKLAWKQPLFPSGSNKNESNLDEQERGPHRPSVQHRLAAMPKAGRNFPAKVLSPRRHVATIFPQRQNSSDFSSFSLDTPECNPHSLESAPKSTDSKDENRLSNDGINVKKSEHIFQASVLSGKENSKHLSNQRLNRTSPPHQNEFKNILEPPKHEASKQTQLLERESGTPTLPTVTQLGEADFFDPPLPLEPTLQASIRPASYQQQRQRHASSLEQEPEPNPHRSKSLKSISLHGYGLRKSQPPKARERHFSENTSMDSALSRLTLRDEFPIKSGYTRRFKSFSELSSCDENESWALYSDEPDRGLRSATISRPIDYGIFGKEQQLAFLENVKKSLTQGRLWKPNFLKNPGFLKDDVKNAANPQGSSSSNSPSNQVAEEALGHSAPLNIYEEDMADSDWDSDTTTDDEYYLDENDKESEL